jgi:hypothetical protein
MRPMMNLPGDATVESQAKSYSLDYVEAEIARRTQLILEGKGDWLTQWGLEHWINVRKRRLQMEGNDGT